MKRATILLCLVLSGTLFSAVPGPNQEPKANTASAARAPKSAFTLHKTVEIPGTTLGPGNYVIRLVDFEPDRNMMQILNTVQIWNSDETQLQATCYTMPDYNLPAVGKPLLTFFEGTDGTQIAIRSWFYPAETHGEQFVYPQAQARKIAAASQVGVLAVPTEMLNMVNIADRAQPPAVRTSPQKAPTQLPKTASQLPLLASLGALALLAAAAFGSLCGWLTRAVGSR